MLSSMKQQFVELLSDIGFVKEGIVAKDVHLRNLLTHTLLFWHFLENLNFELKIILEYIRTIFHGNT